jgi:hypothetical protein
LPSTRNLREGLYDTIDDVRDDLDHPREALRIAIDTVIVCGFCVV